MTKVEGDESGAQLAPKLVACGCVVTAWVLLTRHVRVLERRVNTVAWKAELARRDADHRFEALEEQVAATAAVANGAAEVANTAADVVQLQSLRLAAQELMRQAEDDRRAYDAEAPKPE